MLKGKISLQSFAGAISKSITKANEMLQTSHREAVMRVVNDERGILMPPPTPLMIQNVKVKFKANVSRSEYERDSSDLLIDLSKPDGNFSGELEFVPFSPDMLRSAKNGDRYNGQNPERPSRNAPAHPQHMSRPMRQGARPLMSDTEQAYEPHEDSAPPVYPSEEIGQGAYDESETPRNYSLDS